MIIHRPRWIFKSRAPATKDRIYSSLVSRSRNFFAKFFAGVNGQVISYTLRVRVHRKNVFKKEKYFLEFHELGRMTKGISSLLARDISQVLSKSRLAYGKLRIH